MLRSSSLRKKETVILFTVGGCMFAIAANAVDEIREIAGLRHFPSRLPKVRHTLERQNREYFVVDAATHFRMSDANPSRLMVLRHTPVVVIVDAIERMQEIYSIQALPDGFRGEERNWYRGLTVLKGRVVPVVRSEAFITKAEITLLNALLRGKGSMKPMVAMA
jgi:chemotaxis signal transduction protein